MEGSLTTAACKSCIEFYGCCCCCSLLFILSFLFLLILSLLYICLNTSFKIYWLGIIIFNSVKISQSQTFYLNNHFITLYMIVIIIGILLSRKTMEYAQGIGLVCGWAAVLAVVVQPAGFVAKDAIFLYILSKKCQKYFLHHLVN